MGSEYLIYWVLRGPPFIYEARLPTQSIKKVIAHTVPWLTAINLGTHFLNNESESSTPAPLREIYAPRTSISLRTWLTYRRRWATSLASKPNMRAPVVSTILEWR